MLLAKGSGYVDRRDKFNCVFVAVCIQYVSKFWLSGTLQTILNCETLHNKEAEPTSLMCTAAQMPVLFIGDLFKITRRSHVRKCNVHHTE